MNFYKPNAKDMLSTFVFFFPEMISYTNNKPIPS